MSETKVCSKCGEEKSVEAFRLPSGRKSRRPHCKSCEVERDRVSRKKDPERYRVRRRAWRYGLSPEALAALERITACEICGATVLRRRAAHQQHNIDHCHETGVVRGVLCFDCNTGLGKLGDSIPSLQRAIAYLERAATFAAVDSVVLDAGHPHAA